MKDLDSLTNPELSKTTGGKAAMRDAESKDKDADDRLSSDVSYSSAEARQNPNSSWEDAGPRLSEKAEDSLEAKSNNFVAGGCVPEEDGEMQCKFNIEDPQTFRVEDEVVNEFFSVRLNDINQSFDNVEQTSSRSSTLEENKGRVLVINDDEGQVFCEASDNKQKVQCTRVKPKTTLSYQKRVGKDSYRTQKGNISEDEDLEQIEAEAVKFPEGGEVSAVPSRDMVVVSTEDAGFML
jgi:hypothetical protein